MRNYRTTDDVVAFRIEDGKEAKLHLKDLNLFASGAFSNVYRGVVETESHHMLHDVVVKKTWPKNRGVPLEVKILKKLNRLKHKNIVRLMYSYHKEHGEKTCLALIFEYIPLNLYQYLKQNNRRIDIIEIKMVIWQLFRGQFHLQRMDICHRDIKPQNLLFNAETGLLKISDFGSSALDVKKSPQPSYHVTRYYRPPELLLNSRTYGCEIDIWSCGCVFGELLKGAVFLPGKSSENQAEIIFDVLGIPSSSDLSAMNASKAKFKDIMQKFVPTLPSKHPNIDMLLTNTSKGSSSSSISIHNNAQLSQKDMLESIAVLEKILAYNPLKRLNGSELLLGDYFKVLFAPGTVRANGTRIGCLTQRDSDMVRIGDKTITGSAESAEPED